MNAITLPSFVAISPLGAQESLPKRALRVKFGVDPTSPNLHFGHAVALRQLRALQEQGHSVLLVIGDFTAAIGDPTGRNTTRPALTASEITDNAKTYLDQVFLFLKPEQTQIHWNSEWLGLMSAAEMVKLAARATVAQMSQRNDFAKRLEAGTPVSLHEFLYPLLQAHDSVHLACDMEFGGTDQTFNLIMGRTLMASEGQVPQVVATVPLLVGLDGERKMSKSFKNDIGLIEPAVDQLTKIMKLPDKMVSDWGGVLTDTSPETWLARLSSENPREVKLDLARDILLQVHAAAVVEQATGAWQAAVNFSATTDNLDPAWIDHAGPIGLAEAMVAVGLCASRTVARQKIDEGAVRINGEKVSDRTYILDPNFDAVVQVGKRNFKRIALRTGGSSSPKPGF